MIDSRGSISRISTVQKLPIDLSKAWDFFSSPKNLAKITPSELNFNTILGGDSKAFPGQIIEYKVSPLPLYSVSWVTEITHLEKEHYFVDEQRFGPYAFWHHKHFFKQIPGGVEMKDLVDFKIPFGILGKIFLKRLIHKELTKIFKYRNDKLVELFGTYQ